MEPPRRQSEENRKIALLSSMHEKVRAAASHSMRRQLVASFGTAAVILLVGGASYLSVQELQQTTDLLSRTYRFTDELSALSGRITAAELAHRGYLLTADQELLRPYRTAASDAEFMILELRAMTDNVVQEARLSELSAAVDELLELMRNSVAQRDRLGAGAALNRERMEEGRTALERIVDLIHLMRDEEQRLLNERSAALRSNQALAGIVLASGTFGAFLFAIAASVTLKRAVRDRDVAERALEEKNERLRVAREEAERGRAAVEEALRVRDETLKLIRRSEERLRALVTASSQVVWTANAKGEFAEPQLSWVGFTGQSLEAASGEGWLEALHPEDREAARTAWRRAVADATVFDHHYRLRRADGTYRVTTVRAVPVRDPDGSVREWVGANSDITERREAEEERELLIAALERSNRELDQFAYITSHDLKAPLRGIASLATWIEEDLGPAATTQVTEHLRLLRGRVRRLENLIDGILQYSRAGRVNELVRNVDLKQLISEVIEFIAPPSQVTIDVDPGLPVVQAPRVQLQQVFINLLGNAIKHSGDKPSRIQIRGRELEGAWELSVTDDGPGIDPRYHDRIFTLFQTLQSRDKVEGSGIGLAIVKKIVEGAGGRVWVESKPGEGARFVFVWPKPAVVEARVS